MDIRDPAMVEAIARADESRAQILRGRAAGNPAYRDLADEAERRAKKSARAAAGIADEAEPDLEGTAARLSDSEGNFAANAEVARAGGIGINASNTDVATGRPAVDPARAGTAAPVTGRDLSGTGRPDARSAVAIPADWRELSWQERRSIASKVSDSPISTGDDANAAIEAELQRRGG